MYISVFINSILLNRNVAVKQQDLENFRILKNYLENPIMKKAKTRIISSQKRKYKFILGI